MHCTYTAVVVSTAAVVVLFRLFHSSRYTYHIQPPAPETAELWIPIYATAVRHHHLDHNCAGYEGLPTDKAVPWISVLGSNSSM